MSDNTQHDKRLKSIETLERWIKRIDKFETFALNKTLPLAASLTSTYMSATHPTVQTLSAEAQIGVVTLSTASTFVLAHAGRFAGKCSGYLTSTFAGVGYGLTQHIPEKKSDRALIGCAAGALLGKLGPAQAFALAGLIYGGMLGHEKGQDFAIDLFTKNDPNQTSLHIDHQQGHPIALSSIAAAPVL